MRLRIVLPIALLLALSAVAEAQPGMTPPGQTQPRPYQPQPQYAPTFAQYGQLQPTRTVSYGTHVFLADLASWAVLGAGADSELGALGAAGMFLGGPIVHLAHGNNSGAVYSLLARTGLPLGGALLFSSGCDDGGDCAGGIVAGILLGYGTALAVDWFHLSKKTEVVEMPQGWASLRPSLSISGDSAQAGLGMSF